MSIRSSFSTPRALTTAILAGGTFLFAVAQFDFSASAQSTPTATPTATPATTPTTTPTTTTAAKSANTATTPTNTARPSTFEATINADATLVRCAPNTDTGYSFGTLSAGQTVTVVETQTGWMRVRTVGPVFEGWGAYVPALPGVTLSADGKTIKITGTAPINAPNDTADFNPDRSWKAIGYLTTGDELPVLDVIKGEHDTFYAVPLTAKTSGWISEIALTRKDSNAPKIEPKTEPKTDIKSDTKTDTKPELSSDVVIETATEIVPTTTTDTTKTAKITRNKPVAKPEEPKTPSAAQLARAKFEPLEATWKSLAKETCSTGDLQELHVSFLAIAQDNTALQSTRMNARARSTQIATILELRGLKERMREVANRQKLETQEVADLEKWLLARQQYDAVGVLNASLVYDGVRLPRLYRLQDPVSGFTTAYLMEDSELKLSSMLGLVIGVKGPVHFDESLRRNLITPKTAAVIQAGKEVEISSATEPTGNSKAASADDSGK